MKRNIAADYIRVLSILYIIGFWHLQAYGRADPWIEHFRLPNYMTITALALFVFMSGSFIGTKDMSSPGAVKRFYVDRFWAIYLPFVAATLVFIAFRFGDVTSLVKGALLVGMLAEPAALTLWFVNMIVLFYIVAPLLIRLRHKPIAYVGVVAAIVAGLCALELATGRVDQRLILYFPVFAAGIAIDPRRIPDWRLALAGAVLAIAGVALPDVEVADLQYSYQLVPFALGAALAVTAVLFRVGGRWVSNPGLEALVSASYFAYLLHRPIYKLTLKVLPLDNAFAISAGLLVVGLPMTLVAAWLLHRLYGEATRHIRSHGLAGSAAR
jgi:peptidoglycan/LPS O-acetylase OafA/YrhL